MTFSGSSLTTAKVLTVDISYGISFGVQVEIREVSMRDSSLWNIVGLQAYIPIILFKVDGLLFSFELSVSVQRAVFVRTKDRIPIA